MLEKKVKSNAQHQITLSVFSAKMLESSPVSHFATSRWDPECSLEWPRSAESEAFQHLWYWKKVVNDTQKGKPYLL